MLKIPKGLKKKKKGKKKSKEEELFTSEELEQYRRARAEGASSGGGQWAPLAAVDGVLQGCSSELQRIKASSFYQREVKREPPPPPPPPQPLRHVAELTEADFARPAPAPSSADEGVTSEEEEDDEDDLFDTSYVEAAARGEVRLAVVPDSPEAPDDDLFDTSHLTALISGAPARPAAPALDIGLAVGVLTGRIDHVSIAVPRRKRTVPGDLLLEDASTAPVTPAPPAEPLERSILDADEDLPPASPVDLSVSLHTQLLQQARPATPSPPADEEDLEFAALATTPRAPAPAAEATLDTQLEPVVQDSWSAFEADKNHSVFAEFIVEDQIDVIDPYLGQDDPFDTLFVEAVVPLAPARPPPPARPPAPVHPALEEDDDFDPRAAEPALNNRRKSSVRIHLTDPAGLRESITSESRDLLAGSASDLTQLDAAPLHPTNPDDEPEVDPFDTTIVDKIVAPGKVELRLLEQELIEATPAPVPLYRVPSDPDFDPRAEHTDTRRPSRPENLACKSVVFVTPDPERSPRPPKPVTPFRPPPPADLLQAAPEHSVKVLTPGAPSQAAPPEPDDPFDTSFAAPSIAPTKTELKLLAREFSCEEPPARSPDLLEPDDDLFPVKALSPEPLRDFTPPERDPFDTSFTGELQPGRTELRLLESELLQ